MGNNIDILKDKIWIPGSQGMLGSALVRNLQSKGINNFIASSRKDLDLSDINSVKYFYKKEKPEIVILSAAKVGGIYANNKYPADFITDNLNIQFNVISLAKEFQVKKLVFIGSSCIYPKECPQPIKEEYLLTGPLEVTNEYYAIAKIAGIKMCEAYRKQYNCNFISVMPTNLYGPNDNFDPKNSHVIAALLSRFHKAKTENSNTVEVWGSGKPRREFLHVDDLAEAIIFLTQNYSDISLINVGTGKDLSILELAKAIQKTVGYQGEIKLNDTYPDGTYQKLLDLNKIHKLGWKHKIDLEEGLALYYKWYLNNVADE